MFSALNNSSLILKQSAPDSCPETTDGAFYSGRAHCDHFREERNKRNALDMMRLSVQIDEKQVSLVRLTARQIRRSFVYMLEKVKVNTL